MQRPGDRGVQAFQMTQDRTPGRPRDAHAGVPAGALRALGLSLVLLGSVGGAAAQFKVVAPDGAVTYSDRPPATGKVQKLQPGASSATAGAELPFALRQVAARYPVMLITAAACVPCDAGRRLLQDRGVPFTERTASSNDDADELRRLEQTAELPVVRLGAQRVVGYSADEWTALLDAAGYPRTSALPAGYRARPAQPLAPPRAVEPLFAQPRAVPPPAAPAATPAAPGGIRF